MKAYSKLTFFLILPLFIISCNQEAEDNKENEIVKKNNSTSSSKVRKNVNPKDENFRNKIYGVWRSNHEPTAMQFFEDGSFRFFIPSDFNEQDSIAEEDLDFGTWTILNGKLALKSEKGENQDIEITWINDNLIYFGNIEEEYDSTFGSREEFARELGFSKIDE
jgi:hypothetical protein